MAAWELSDTLAATYALTAATSADADELYALMVAHRMSVLGVCRITPADIHTWLESVGSEHLVNRVVRRRDTDRVVQWWCGWKDQGDPRWMISIDTHPEISETEADQLWDSGWAQLAGWVRALTAGPGQALVRSGCLGGDDANEQRLQRAGFSHERTYWEMAGPVLDSAPTSVAVPGLSFSTPGDPADVHRIFQAGFADHWDFYPQSPADWLKAETAATGHDPALWTVARLDSEPVAAMILSRRSEVDRELYVQELATLSGFRRRGVGSALLMHAFEIARREGFAGLVLHVDSDNPSGAPRLYGDAGLSVRHASHQYALGLSLGSSALTEASGSSS